MDSQKSVLLALVVLGTVFAGLLLTNSSSDMLTGSVATEIDLEGEPNLGAKDIVVYVLGVVVLALLVIYLIMVHRNKRALDRNVEF